MLTSVAARTLSRQAFRKAAVLALTTRHASCVSPMRKFHSDLEPQQQEQGQGQEQHIVVALGGNALLKRGEAMTMVNQRKNIADGVASLARLLQNNRVTLLHGNGPQVGLLLLESTAYEKETGLESIPLDVLDAQTEGMIGYMIEQEIQKYLSPTRGLVTVLSQIVCNPNDPAFTNPTKFVGPVYSKEEAEKLSYPVKADGEYFRRVVPSPLPVKLTDNHQVALQRLTADNCIVICAGGGGIPVIQDPTTGHMQGIEAVIDKDRAAAMVGKTLGANGLLILTDVSGVATSFGSGEERWIRRASPQALTRLLAEHHFPAGSMGPKVESAIDFVQGTPHGWAAIGSLAETDRILAGLAGTTIQAFSSLRGDDENFLEFYEGEQHKNRKPKVA